MSVDLLGTVKGGGGGKRKPPADGGDVDEIDLEEDEFAPPPTEAEREMAGFFKAVEAIKIDMAEIRTLQKDILTTHEKSKTIVKTKEMQKQREVMQVRPSAAVERPALGLVGRSSVRCIGKGLSARVHVPRHQPCA